MEISLVVQLDKYNSKYIQTRMKQFSKLTNELKTEIYFVIHDLSDYEDELHLEGVEIVSASDFELTNLEGEYVCFIDDNYHYKFYNPLLDLLYSYTGNDIDFVSANINAVLTDDMRDSHEIFNYSYAYSALKLIRKERLINDYFAYLHPISREKVQYLNIDLYLKDYHYICASEATYRTDLKKEREILLDFIQEYKYVTQQVSSLKSVSLVAPAIIEKLFINLDSDLFVNSFSEDEQIEAYEILNYYYQFIKADIHTQEISEMDIEDDNKKGYYQLMEYVDKKLYSEANQFFQLIRSRRYWKNQVGKYQTYFKKHPKDPEDSLSWKITKPLRFSTRILKRLKDKIYKLMVIVISNFLKLFYVGKSVWLVAERKDQAEDNGYFFFKYCREVHPNQKVYYIIDKNSPHLHKVKDLGNIIFHSSFKHVLFMLIADKYISAWTFQEVAYPEPVKKFKRLFLKNIKNKKNISLQHGVILQNIAPYLSKEKYNQDLIIASSEYEKKIIEKTLGYSPDEIEVTGLSRFDNLYDRKTKKQILLMPTWRRHLFKMNKSQFMKSDYYQAYSNLIHNERLLEMLEKYDTQLIFYVHYQMQKYMETFAYEHPRIKFVVKSDDEGIVSELLKESAVLITDYSSVSFDFLYMDKPVILYQFDPENNHHTPTKEIQYKELGNIVSKEDELVDYLGKVLKNGCRAEEIYIENSRRIFKYKDQNNNKRIYDKINSL